MFIGDLLIAHGLVTTADVTAALDHQKVHGGRLGEALVSLGKLRAADLETVLQGAPVVPNTVEDTGLQLSDLLNLLTKVMYTSSAETATAIADTIKLSNRLVQLLLDQAAERKLLEALGSVSVRIGADMRYALTEKGKAWATEALIQNQYVGPAPVSLSAYCDRIHRQRITNERVDREAIDGAFANLIISRNFIQQIGPAINSGQAILLYGPPGNGKTTVGERIGRIFKDVAYIPYCFEVEGQIIKVFDAGVHEPLQQPAEPLVKRTAVRREDFDARWVPCRRPFIVAGGELTLEMLDLSFNESAKFYEAPLHVKALGGIFMIDDFGRQIVSPEALLNRWIVPLGRRVDYLKLHTGKSFSLPFDELIIFSTNLSPQDLMDPAFLRRIPYKIEIAGPSDPEYRQIFLLLSKAAGMEANAETIDFVIAALRARNGAPLASCQPKFIIDQLKAACKFAGIPPQFQPGLLAMALDNLAIPGKPGADVLRN